MSALAPPEHTINWWLPLWLIAATIALALLVAYLSHRRGRVGEAAPVCYGLDFSWARPSPAQLADDGYAFVCRYLSRDASKSLSATEAAGYIANGLAVVSNWEDYAQAPLDGWDQGLADAHAAVAQHAACGGGPDDPIYFSVDFDVAPSQYAAVVSYMRAINGVIGVARTGAYGGYYVIQRLFDDGLIAYGWQTFAWSYGSWDPRAQLRQISVNDDYYGSAVDTNEAWSAAYGGWGQATPPSAPPEAAVILNHPTKDDRVDLFYVARDYTVAHRWGTTMSDLWTAQGGVENIGGMIIPSTLSACWDRIGDNLSIVGISAPDEYADAPPGCGQYWGCTLGLDGRRSGWGSLDSVFAAYPPGINTTMLRRTR